MIGHGTMSKHNREELAIEGLKSSAQHTKAVQHALSKEPGKAGFPAAASLICRKPSCQSENAPRPRPVGLLSVGNHGANDVTCQESHG